VFVLRCFGVTGLRAPDLVEQMAAATVLPLVGMFFTGLFYLLHMEILHLTVTRIRRRAVHRAYTASYGAVLLVLLHYASGGIWQLTAGVLSAPCVDLDPDRVFPNSSLTVMQYVHILRPPVDKLATLIFFISYIFFACAAGVTLLCPA
jgi:hypothetical protein